MTRAIMCKRCGTRMWDDEDGALYCPNCGWEAGSPVTDDDPVTSLYDDPTIAQAMAHPERIPWQIG